MNVKNYKVTGNLLHIDGSLAEWGYDKKFRGEVLNFEKKSLQNLNLQRFLGVVLLLQIFFEEYITDTFLFWCIELSVYSIHW